MNDRETSLWESLLFDFDGATVTQAVIAALTRRSLYVVRSFDLRSALATHADRIRPFGQSPWECECPHHGTAQCTCQFTVLLVYGSAPQPVTLTVHCRDNRTQAQIVHDATNRPDPHLAEQVMTALVEVGLTLHVAPRLTAEVTTDTQ